MISQSFEPSRGRVAKVLVQKLLRAVEAEKRGLKNRVWPHLVFRPWKKTNRKQKDLNCFLVVLALPIFGPWRGIRARRCRRRVVEYPPFRKHCARKKIIEELFSEGLREIVAIVCAK